MSGSSADISPRFLAEGFFTLKRASTPVVTVFALLLSFGSSPALAVSIGPTGNAYEYIANTDIAWTDANTAVLGMQYSGVTGHLATIFSQAENDYIQQSLLTGVIGSVWLGGSDAQAEGTWKWVTGQQFWQGGTNGMVGPDVNYANWVSANEPNNSGTGENYLSMYGAWVSGGTQVQPGKWNDQVNNPAPGSDYYSIKGYVVQYDIVTPVPVPSAVWLFGSGLLGLLGMVRRRQQ